MKTILLLLIFLFAGCGQEPQKSGNILSTDDQKQESKEDVTTITIGEDFKKDTGFQSIISKYQKGELTYEEFLQNLSVFLLNDRDFKQALLENVKKDMVFQEEVSKFVPQGLRGKTGVTGPKGEKGEIGLRGPTGTPGRIGPQGIKGEKGDTPELPPSVVISSIPDEIAETSSYEYQVTIETEESAAPAYFLLQQPEGMVINSQTGLIEWQITEQQKGLTYDVCLIVMAGNVSSNVQCYELVVN